MYVIATQPVHLEKKFFFCHCLNDSFQHTKIYCIKTFPSKYKYKKISFSFSHSLLVLAVYNINHCKRMSSIVEKKMKEEKMIEGEVVEEGKIG